MERTPREPRDDRAESRRLPRRVRVHSLVLTSALGLGLGVGLLTLRSPDERSAPALGLLPTDAPPRADASPARTPAAPASWAASLSPSAPRPPDTPPLPFGAPGVATFRAEVARNPHGTPPSLLRFAAEVARRETAARDDAGLRDALFDELARCAGATDGRLPTSARSFCLLRARTLAAAHPARFARPLDALLTRTPDAVALGAPLRGLP